MKLPAAQNAWSYFTWVLQLTQDPRAADHVREADGAIAEFIRENPGAFEQRLLAGLPELAGRTRSEPGVGSDLGAFLGSKGALPNTLAAIAPRAGIEACLHAVSRHAGAIGELGLRSGPELLAYFRDRAGPDALDGIEVPQAVRDALLQGAPLPELLEQLSKAVVSPHTHG